MSHAEAAILGIAIGLLMLPALIWWIEQ